MFILNTTSKISLVQLLVHLLFHTHKANIDKINNSPTNYYYVTHAARTSDDVISTNYNLI